MEASADGEQWGIVARLAPVLPFPELRTRRSSLERPVQARWLRLRVTTPRAAVIAELAAFERVPVGWPPLDVSRPDSRVPLWPMLTVDRLAALSAALRDCCWRLRSGPPGPGAACETVARRRLRQAVLVLLALASLAAWPNGLNFRYRTIVHDWDFAHYYLGAKYFRELGYTRLYTCAASPTSMTASTFATVRSATSATTPSNDASKELLRAPECRNAFSKARWAEFRSDVGYFREALGMWFDLRQDHGFNATPAWILAGGAVASLVPANPGNVAALTLVDVVSLAAVFAALGGAFGIEAACLGAGFFGLNALALIFGPVAPFSATTGCSGWWRGSRRCGPAATAWPASPSATPPCCASFPAWRWPESASRWPGRWCDSAAWRRCARAAASSRVPRWR